MPRRAFTLIELLVVVAIIAILAAIAVPNFLEAMTRAKVSRVKADLRTVATAIESYTVDYGRVPYDGEPGLPHHGWVNSMARLTSPIAYFSTIHTDPFQDPTFPNTTLPGHSHYLDPVNTKNHSYDYGSGYWHGIHLGQSANYVRNFGLSMWKIGSAGPDLRFENDGSFYGMEEIYDPTNGTVSDGDVYRAQRGQLD